MTAVFATKISAFDPENISQRVLLTKERLYAIDQLNGEGRQQSYAAALLMMVLLCAGAGLLLTAAVTGIERSVYLFRRNKKNGNNSGAGKTEYAEEGELVPYTNAGK